jgi:hypothetical protein
VAGDVRYVPILLQPLKIEQPKKSRESWSLGFFAAASLFSFMALALARRFKWNSRSKSGLAGQETNSIAAPRPFYKSKGPFDDR